MEKGVQLMEGRQAWPLHTMGMPVATTTTTSTCFDDYSCSSSGWEQSAPFGCFGLLAADVHDLFPLFAGMEPAPPPSSAHGVAVAIPGELDDLLLNFWDAGCHDGDVGEPPLKAQQEEEEAAFNSSCATHEQGYRTPTDSFTIHCDDDDQALSSIFSAGPPPAAERAAFQQQAPATEAEPLSSSSSSSCRGDPRAAGAGLPLPGRGAARGPARAPPLPRTCGPSLKRAATREESEQASAESSGGGKRRKGAGVVVVSPFALLKPDGLDGGATLADINARVLMRPARPVRHPVGEFACAPRVSADQPGISGKAVAGFTRLHTPGRGSITIIRTRG